MGRATHHKSPVDAGYISLNHLKPLLDYLEECGLPLTPMLDTLGITNEQRADVDIVIDTQREHAAFVLAEALSGDPGVGVNAGMRMTVANLGLLGHLLMSCTNAADLMEFHTRYSRIVGNGLQAEYSLRPDSVVLTLHRRDPHVQPGSRQVLEYSIAGWITIARWLMGQDFAPQLVELPLSSSVDPIRLREVLRCPIEIGRPHIRIHIGLDILASPFRHTYPGLRDVLMEQVRLALDTQEHTPDAWLSSVQRHLLALLAEPALTMVQLAVRVGTSSRTLQRALNRRGLTYSALLDGTRKRQALALVCNASVPFSEISLALGFAEQAAFHRAFKRWFGSTPGEYRRNHAASGP